MKTIKKTKKYSRRGSPVVILGDLNVKVDKKQLSHTHGSSVKHPAVSCASWDLDCPILKKIIVYHHKLSAMQCFFNGNLFKSSHDTSNPSVH